MSDLSEKKIVLTAEGLKKLEDELQELKVNRRHEVAAKIKEARGQGDLSENAEYDFAKAEQAEVESRIAEIEKMLKNIEVIDSRFMSKDRIHIGSTVRLFDIEFDEELFFNIVGSTEADPANGKISNESPLGIALLDHVIGDIINVEAPAGNIKYKILEIL